jgi:hypothetical protein
MPRVAAHEMEVVLVPGERLGPRTYPRVWSACVDTKSVGPPRRILRTCAISGMPAPGGGNR